MGDLGQEAIEDDISSFALILTGKAYNTQW